MASQRLTKKCFEVVDRTEIRLIAMKGMGLPAKQAYKLDNKGIVDWVFTNAKEFADVDLDHVNAAANGTLRPGVFDYLAQLQGFILKTGEKPVWPGDVETEDVEVPAVKAEPTESVAVEVVEPPTKEKPVLSPKKYSKAKQVTSAKAVKPKTTFSKARVNKTTTAPTDTESMQQTLEGVKANLATLEELTTAIAATQKNAGNEDYKRLEKGLLYVINMLCEDGQEVTSLEQVPEPNEYITQ